ncbi:MAG: MarR family winged helix-turn-helix transcriptional regulator [Streptosporangiaceae bacterium]
MNVAEGEVLAQVTADVRRGASRLAMRLRAERPARGMSGMKLAILAHLQANGPSTPTAIAAAERHQPQSLTRSLAELCQSGYVLRSRNDADRRSSLLCLTQAGRRALQQDMADRDAWLMTVLAKLPELELEILHLGAKIMGQLA